MLDFSNEDNALYIACFPFTEIQANKEQGVKVLEEASEFREAYDDLAKISLYYQENPDDEDREENTVAHMNAFILEACDTIQAVVNTVVAVLGDDAQDALIAGMEVVTDKNAERGYYGEPEETEE